MFSLSNRVPILLVIVCGAFAPAVGQAAEPKGSPSDEQRLLGLVPKSMESVFCVRSPSNLQQWEDLTEASITEIATCFSTLLSAHRSDLIGLTGRRLRCVICTVRDVRRPQSGSQLGPDAFDSKRCELLLLAENLPADWLDKVARAPGCESRKAGKLRFVEIALRGESSFVAQLDDNLVCIANDAPLLTEVLQSAELKAAERSCSIESDPEFRLARSYISKSPPFWGVRLFGRVVRAKDPTSVRNAKTIVEMHDQQAVFVTVEFPATDANSLPMCYASEDPAAPAQFVKAYRVKKTDEPSVVTFDGGARRCTIASTLFNLDDGGDDPGALFIGLCATFGQGFAL